MTFRSMSHVVPQLLLIWLVVTTAVQAQQTNDVAIPQPVPLIDSEDMFNILLLGSDTTNPQNSGRTDVIIVASIHQSAGTVSLLSIPRDLYVYIPGWQRQRINTAFGHGNSENPDGGGIALLKETIRHNLGLEIDRYARIDFRGFKGIIDALGGVVLSVDCAIEDWRLITPDLDASQEENWELVTLPVGIHTMDGATALWYVRSRRTSSDFDRGRRQHDMLRAIWRRTQELGVLEQLPDIWQQITETVQTDLTLADVVGLLPVALNYDPTRLNSFTFRLNTEVTNWRSPEGASVLLPQNEAIFEMERHLLIAPTQNQLWGHPATVEIINASGFRDMDTVAADRLAWEGFEVSVGSPSSVTQRMTTIIDYTGATKGNPIQAIQTVMRVPDNRISQQPIANRTVDYQVTLGSDYYSCTYGVIPPQNRQD